MILGSDKILDLVKGDNLVEGLSERELSNPEGPGFDLRSGEFYEIKGEGFLGLEDRKTAQSKLIASFKNKDRFVVLKPGDYFLVKTIEKVQMPKNLLANVFPRSTLFRSGINLISGKISPGYFGNLTFGITNLGSAEFRIELGARIAFILFHEVLGKTNLSRGQWKGGRVSAENLEKQI
jgi:deoxycytidine triphosphate deaminase